jgi:hypothetical protein
MPSIDRARVRARRCIMRLPILALAVCASAAFASPAMAAPQAATTCNGSLTKAPTADEPNNLNYQFQCTWGVSAYTILANRTPNDFSTIDDFSTVANVVDSAGTINPTQSFTCEGSLPGNGVNCNAGGKWMDAPQFAEGSFDLTVPFCSHVATADELASTAAASRSRNRTSKPVIVPQAFVQVIVTDTTGAQDGPFRLPLQGKCPAVKVHKTSKKTKKHAAKHAANT